MAQNDSGRSKNRTPSHDAELDQLDRFGASHAELDKADDLLYEGWWAGHLAPWKSARRTRAREQYNSGKANITGMPFDWAAWRRDGGGRTSPKSGEQSGDTGDGGSEQTGDPDTDTNSDLGDGGGGGDD